MTAPKGSEGLVEKLETRRRFYASKAVFLRGEARAGHPSNRVARELEASDCDDIALLLSQVAQRIEELEDILRAARSDAILEWCSSAGRTGLQGTYPELVERFGVPAHIAKMDAALNQQEPGNGG